VAEHDRLLLEALAINPQLPVALSELAHSRYEYTGDFAEGIRIVEQSIALDPQSTGNKEYAAIMYLDVNELAAAAALLQETKQPSMSLVELAQYRREPRQAAELVRALPADYSWSGTAFSPPADAIRDEAIATGDYASALKMLESRYAIGSPSPGARGGMRMWNRGLGLVYAHTLILAGEAERGRKLLTGILVQIDSESVGRTENWFARERAMAYAMLGDDERALEQLAASLKLGHYARWWYTAELNPIFDRLRRDPRFQALVAQAKQHQLEQRALVDEMREKGAVPRRVVRSE
jgi:tetratricopeptide (TPR) repeat protein